MNNDKILDEITGELKKVKKSTFYGWTLTRVQSTGFQRLLYSNEHNELYPQTIRDNISELRYSLTVFSRHSENKMGNFTITIDPIKSIKEQILEALDNAGHLNNTPWNLLEPVPGQTYEKVQKSDPAIKANPLEATNKLVKKASEITASLKNVNVNYAELFINYHDTLRLTSTGICMPMESSDIYFEIAMEKRPLPNTQEIFNNKTALSIKDLNLEKFINDAALETKYLGEVKIPKTDEHAVILVKADVINEIFHHLLAQLDGTREYVKRPFLKIGDSICQKETIGDKINIKLDPYINYMAETTPFTGEGMKAESTNVIENNIVKNRFISNRIGQYLNLAPTPTTGNVVLEAGSLSYNDLIKKAPRVIEIISFSSLLLNSDYLTYSSEIKLAREWDNETGNVRFLKGGVVAGNIKENLRDCLLSRSTTKHNIVANMYESAKGYAGPDYMLIKSGVTISGK